MPKRKRGTGGGGGVVPPSFDLGNYMATKYDNVTVAGTWILDQLDGSVDTTASRIAEFDKYAQRYEEALAFTGVSGLSIRLKWNDIEPTNTTGGSPGPNAPTYDMGVFQHVRDRFPNNKLSIRIMAGKHTPLWWNPVRFNRFGVINAGDSTYPCPFVNTTANDAHPTWLQLQGADNFDQADASYDEAHNVTNPTVFYYTQHNNPAAAGEWNSIFEQGYTYLANELINWCKQNDVVMLHMPMYGHDWAEIYNGTMLTAVPGYNVNKVIYAHQRLMDITYQALLDQGSFGTVCCEFPGSGYDSGNVSPWVFRYLARKIPPTTGRGLWACQSNNLGSIYTFGTALGNATLSSGTAADRVWRGAQAYGVKQALGPIPSSTDGTSTGVKTSKECVPVEPDTFTCAAGSQPSNNDPIIFSSIPAPEGTAGAPHTLGGQTWGAQYTKAKDSYGNYTAWKSGGTGGADAFYVVNSTSGSFKIATLIGGTPITFNLTGTQPTGTRYYFCNLNSGQPKTWSAYHTEAEVPSVAINYIETYRESFIDPLLQTDVKVNTGTPGTPKNITNFVPYK